MNSQPKQRRDDYMAAPRTLVLPHGMGSIGIREFMIHHLMEGDTKSRAQPRVVALCFHKTQKVLSIPEGGNAFVVVENILGWTVLVEADFGVIRNIWIIKGDRMEKPHPSRYMEFVGAVMRHFSQDPACLYDLTLPEEVVADMMADEQAAEYAAVAAEDAAAQAEQDGPLVLVAKPSGGKPVPKRGRCNHDDGDDEVIRIQVSGGRTTVTYAPSVTHVRKESPAERVRRLADERAARLLEHSQGAVPLKVVA